MTLNYLLSGIVFQRGKYQQFIKLMRRKLVLKVPKISTKKQLENISNHDQNACQIGVL